MQKDNYDYLFKIVLVGDCGTGKTSFLNKYIKDEFNLEMKTTVGVSYLSRNVAIEDKIIKAQIWDSSGADKTVTNAKLFYQGAVGALILYDMTNPTTFANVDKWLKELASYANAQVIKCLVGNKKDLKYLRMIKAADGQKYADNNKLLFAETSALEGIDIDLVVYNIVEEIYKVFKKLKSSKK